MPAYPARIVCLTEETTETLYLLGEDHRIVGISGFTVRPSRARREKPRVSAFTSAKIDRILALGPDLVLGFSDLQADIAAQLIRRGIEVHVFNQRSVADILRTIVVRASAAILPRRPRGYFEEWDEPQISAIRWVSELIGIAGGDDCFPELAQAPLGRDRIIADPLEVPRRAPDLILGSWCGKKFRPERVSGRAGWQGIPAVKSGRLHEVKSSIILQPGPAALTDGLSAIHALVRDWALSGPDR